MKCIKKSWVEVMRIYDTWSTSKANTFGAAVAYFTIFSIAPLLVIIIGVAGIVLSSTTAEQNILTQFTLLFGETGGDFIEALIATKSSPGQSVLMSLLGFVVLLMGSSGVFSQLQNGLDTIFSHLPTKSTVGVWTAVWQKLLSITMVVVLGLIIIVSLVSSALVGVFSPLLASYVPGTEVFLKISDFFISLSLVVFFLTLLYKILPNHVISWKGAFIGGIIASLLFTVSKYVFSWYFASGTAFTSFGAASALVVILFWTYYMAQVFFLCAILVRLYFTKNLRV